jgi:methionine-rich copper-binding protein CopC
VIDPRRIAKRPRALHALSAAAIFAALLLVAVPRALAHAVLVESTPKAQGSVPGPDVAIDLKFNSRVDGSRSALTIVSAGGKAHALTIDAQSAPDHLAAKATGLTKGGYVIRWQALSSDGHISRGQIPFTVQ